MNGKQLEASNSIRKSYECFLTKYGNKSTGLHSKGRKESLSACPGLRENENMCEKEVRPHLEAKRRAWIYIKVLRTRSASVNPCWRPKKLLDIIDNQADPTQGPTYALKEVEECSAVWIAEAWAPLRAERNGHRNDSKSERESGQSIFTAKNDKNLHQVARVKKLHGKESFYISSAESCAWWRSICQDCSHWNTRNLRGFRPGFSNIQQPFKGGRFPGVDPDSLEGYGGQQENTAIDNGQGTKKVSGSRLYIFRYDIAGPGQAGLRINL